jgi:hypothetical protein
MDDPLARLLEMRLRFRCNPEARAYVDRALALVASAIAEEADMAVIDDEVSRLADDLAARFGPRVKVQVQ